jgi:hypothetical protein
MDARAEQQSLNENPLPPVIISHPLHRVYEIDGSIASFEARLAELRKEREETLQYAIANNIAEDSFCKLNVERSVRKSRTLNVDRFREVFPDEYEMACDVERKDLAERLGHVGEKINLTLVDKLVKKPRLEAAQGVITVKESESLSYSVVQK